MEGKSPGDTASDASSWRVGLSRVRITPEGPIPMCGYSPHLSEGVLDDLFAKAMVIDDGHEGHVVLLTADLLFFRQPFSDAVCQRIIAKTGLERCQILLSASHTHAGPVFGLKDPDRFDLEPEHRKSVDRYTHKLLDQLVDLVVSARNNMQAASIAWGTGQVKFVMNRRTITDHGVVMAANPEGEMDPVVPVLRVDDSEGRTRAIVFGCACHPVTLDGQNRKISGDYAGFAQQYLERQYPGTQAMFVIGCGGDANPHPRGGADQEVLARQHGEELGREVERVAFGRTTPVHGPLRPLLAWTDLPLECSFSRQQLAQLATDGCTPWHRHNAQALLSIVDRNEPLPVHYRAAISLWQFGEDLTLVGLPGEAVAGYVYLLKDALGPDRLWVAAYTNESFGYLPTKAVLAEGGHESMGLTLDVGFFAPMVEDVVVDSVRQLALQAGRLD